MTNDEIQTKPESEIRKNEAFAWRCGARFSHFAFLSNFVIDHSNFIQWVI